jgi:hypothetical protein
MRKYQNIKTSPTFNCFLITLSDWRLKNWTTQRASMLKTIKTRRELDRSKKDFSETVAWLPLFLLVVNHFITPPSRFDYQISLLTSHLQHFFRWQSWCIPHVSSKVEIYLTIPILECIDFLGSAPPSPPFRQHPRHWTLLNRIQRICLLIAVYW